MQRSGGLGIFDPERQILSICAWYCLAIQIATIEKHTRRTWSPENYSPFPIPPSSTLPHTILLPAVVG